MLFRSGRWISLGSIEPQFYALLLEKTGISDPMFQAQMNRADWPKMKEKLAAVIRTKSRDAWCEIMEATDVCFAPVLSLAEAPIHPVNTERGTFVDIEGVAQPAPAPRFSRTPGAVQRPPSAPGVDTREALSDWGLEPAEIEALADQGAI